MRHGLAAGAITQFNGIVLLLGIKDDYGFKPYPFPVCRDQSCTLKTGRCSLKLKVRQISYFKSTQPFY
jgi:hypothetical protein